MSVFCYRNLNRKGVVWSVRSQKTGLVVDRATTVYLSNCQFKVSQAGRRRVVKNKRKNVHAGVVGTRIKNHPKSVRWNKVHYNPYRQSSFMDSLGHFVTHADYVKLTKQGCYIGRKY